MALTTTLSSGRLGVTRLHLSRLAQDGYLERLGYGVYRAVSAPADPREAIKAAWLSINPGFTAEERLACQPYDAVVSGRAAAWLLGIGDLVPEPYQFTTPTRRQTQRTEFTYRIRHLPPVSVTLREGLPVTTPEQTIADLVEDRQDFSLVADAGLLDRVRLVELLAPLAARNGYQPHNGEALLAALERP